MKLVLDANIIISLLIRPGKVLELFFLDKLTLYAPELLLVELQRNLDVIQKKTKLQHNELTDLITILQERIFFVPEKHFKKHRKKAQAICPDPKDVVYFALALELNCAVWSNEVRLKNQQHVTVYASHDLIKKYRI